MKTGFAAPIDGVGKFLIQQVRNCSKLCLRNDQDTHVFSCDTDNPNGISTSVRAMTTSWSFHRPFIIKEL